jgi:hypothetical protein
VLFLGRRVSSFSAFIVSEEPRAAWLKPAPNARVRFVDHPPIVKLSDWEKYVDQVGELAMHYRCDLIVFDTISKVLGCDENSARAVTKAFTALRKLTKYDLTILVMHHTNSAGNVRGSGAFRGQSDAVVYLDRVADDRLDRRRTLTVESRLSPTVRIEYRMSAAGELELVPADPGTGSPSRTGERLPLMNGRGQ